MVKSEKVYLPREYLRLVLGTYPRFPVVSKNDVDEIEKILKEHDKNLWNYPLTEIDHIVENDLNVVLVDCSVWNKKIKKNGYAVYEVTRLYRWFEVPGDFKDE